MVGSIKNEEKQSFFYYYFLKKTARKKENLQWMTRLCHAHMTYRGAKIVWRTWKPQTLSPLPTIFIGNSFPVQRNLKKVESRVQGRWARKVEFLFHYFSLLGRSFITEKNYKTSHHFIRICRNVTSFLGTQGSTCLLKAREVTVLKTSHCLINCPVRIIKIFIEFLFSTH